MVKKRGNFMKGFVCIAQGCYVNEDLIDKEKTHYDNQKDKVVLYDFCGNQYFVDKGLNKIKKTKNDKK